MQLNNLFKQPVDRAIDGVIKADDNRQLQLELEEYVVTQDIRKGLGVFAERYLEEKTANGVWISGFYGSGKSHLLKILSLILGGQPVNGVAPADIILPKITDEIIRADLQRCVMTPAKSLLFNIDQKFDTIGGDRGAAILEVFVKVLNEMNGYYGKQGYIAKFERDLDMQGQFGPFRETYLRVTGKTWENDRKALVTTSRPNFAKAYSAHFGVPESEAYTVMNQVKDEYSLSIEDFAEMVKTYLDKQEPGFRLNFFVDEIGQFIGSDSSRMLNLQTVAETLATTCDGRAWLFVTSQADVEGIVGDFEGTAAQDFSKIQGRFKTRLTLASADVHEVVQKRLLAKKETEPEVLTTLYDREKDNLATLFRFGEGSINLPGWGSSALFCDYYPFPHYQFELFQMVMRQLSDHNAFTGKHTSVGERSMLSVFQEVIKRISKKEVGALASFDLMYDGISPTIRGDIQTGIKLAENRFSDSLPVRILKALFLLKWVREFKTTPRNIAILLIDKTEVDIAAHEKAVTEALARLESESLLQRSGDVYEFLTNAEKDIEQEIRNVEIDESEISEKIGSVLFNDLLRDPKFRYEANGQDYSYARKLNGQLAKRTSGEAELSINIITAEHPEFGSPEVLARQSTGKPEIVAVLPENVQLSAAVRDFLKTEKYLRQTSGHDDPNRQAILDRRGQQNSERNTEIGHLAREALSKAALFLNDARLTAVGESEPRTRFHKAAQLLIDYAYPHLRKLKGIYNENTLSKALNDPDDLLSSGAMPLSETESDILNTVMRAKNNNARISAEELVKLFEKRPYGWSPLVTLTLAARLHRMRKIDFRVGGQSLTPQEAFEHLTNSRQRSNVDVCLQQHFDIRKIEALKTFHIEFFLRPNTGNDPRTVGESALEAFRAEAQTLQQLLAQQSRYSFLKVLSPIAEQLQSLAQRDYSYLLENLHDFEDELLDAREDLLTPIKTFMNSPARRLYDEIVQFASEQRTNFNELQAEDVRPIHELVQSPHPYRGNVVPDARAAMSKLRPLIEQKLHKQRQRALEQLEERTARLTESSEFAQLNEPDRQRVLERTETARAEIEAAQQMTSIRDRIQRYFDEDYPAQLALATQLAAAGTPTSAEESSGALATPSSAPPLQYTPVTSIKAECGLSYIATQEQLEEWLDALRQAALSELAKGNRISL